MTQGACAHMCIAPMRHAAHPVGVWGGDVLAGSRSCPAEPSLVDVFGQQRGDVVRPRVADIAQRAA